MRPSAQDITDFKAKLRGTLIQPGDADYDSVRIVWNGMIDRRPSLVAQCHGVADVITSIDFARMTVLSRTVPESCTESQSNSPASSP